MASNYPNSLDSLATNKTDNTATATDHAAHHNDLADAVNKVEAELGTTPKGSYASVKARLDDTVVESTYAAKGDILAATAASTPTAVSVGSNYQALTADSSQSSGLIYSYPTPLGTIIDYAGLTEPSGWKYCNGQSLDRTTYAALFAAIAPSKGTVTISQASPAVITKTSHGLSIGDPVFFTTTGTLPSGLTANTIYYVMTLPVGDPTNTFTLGTTRTIQQAYTTSPSTVAGGTVTVSTAVNTTTAGSGTHTLYYAPYGITNGNSTTFKVPNFTGRSSIGIDTMGGVTDAGTSGSSIIGVGWGEVTHVLTEAELANHSHDFTYNGFTNATIGGASLRVANILTSAGSTTVGTQQTGLNTAHNTVHPVLQINKLIFVGA